VDLLSYKALSKKDIKEAPDEWKYAPVLVSTNAERLNISCIKARMWAKEHKTYVFKWPSHTQRFVNRPGPEKMSQLKEDNAFFRQLFVPNAKCYLNNKVNNHKALVNGSPLISHSLTFDTPDKFAKIVQHIEDMKAQGRDIPYGSEIIVDQPLAVNFIIQPTLDGKPVSTKRQKQLTKLCEISQKYNLDPNSTNIIIIPLTTEMSTSKKWE
jgi:hypothetical protein